MKRIQITLPHLWAMAALFGIFIAVNLVKVVPNDFWSHVRVGQWIVEHRSIPTVDLFSFTRAGQPWAHQSWLMEVVMYAVLRTGDLPLMIFLHALAITAGYAALFGANRLSAGGDLRVAALATSAAALGSANWNVRPQTLSILLFGITLFILERYFHKVSLNRGTVRRRYNILWLLPFLFLLWANGHGGFVFGLLLVGTYVGAALWDWRRNDQPFPVQLMIVGVLCSLATLLTPLGLGIVDYVLIFVNNETHLYNLEFLPPTVRTPDGIAFFGFVIVWIALLVASQYRVHTRQTLSLLAFGALALMSRRNEIWWCFVAAPVMAASLAILSNKRWPNRQSNPGRPKLNRLIFLLFVILVVFSLPWFRRFAPGSAEQRSLVSRNTPISAVATLCQQEDVKRTFNDDAYGSYMIWACPEKPVFVDTRLELYPIQQWFDYQAITYVRYDWQALLDSYKIDTMLLDKGKQKLLMDAANQSPTWRLFYEYDQSIIFRKSNM